MWYITTTFNGEYKTIGFEAETQDEAYAKALRHGADPRNAWRWEYKPLEVAIAETLAEVA